MYRGEKEQRKRDGYGNLQPGWHRQAAPGSNWQIRQTPVFQEQQYGFASCDLQVAKECLDGQCFVRTVASER